MENAIIFLCAGSGRTAATTIYLLWDCGNHEDIRKRLIKEIRTKFPSPEVAPSCKKASTLESFSFVLLSAISDHGLVWEFLGCVIEETFRLRGPLNVGNPRISPGRLLGGEWIPKGVAVETCPYASARDPRVFPDPLRFNPSRWEHATPEMRSMSRPFSFDSRNCVGRHLAEIVLMLTVARIYQLYNAVLDLTKTPVAIDQIDKGVLEPDCDNFYVIPS